MRFDTWIATATLGFFRVTTIIVSVMAFQTGTPGQTTGGPLPYAPIANPLPDTLDQLYRDSLNLKISKIRVNQAGYRPGDRKYFYVVGQGGDFTVLTGQGAVAGSGVLTATGHTTSGQYSARASNNAQIMGGEGDQRYLMTGPVVSGAVFQGELPSLAPGRYRIAAGGDTSAPFVVDDKVYSWVRDALLKFYGINRSGNTDSWFHPPSHLKDGPNGDGSLTGGWSDCGDHLKESQTMSYAFAMLGLAASALPDRDADNYGRNHNDTYRTDGVPDMLYEARVGADFILKSFALAGGNPAEMVTSVGSMDDHNWWGQPQYQDFAPPMRGGPVRPLRKESGATVMGRFAAGLAFMAKSYAPFDKPFADKCLAAAKAMYAYGKANGGIVNSPAYNGENSYYDDMGMAAMALLWATRDTTYKFDLIYNTAIGNKGNPALPIGTFPGGWFAFTDPSLQKGNANTSWASTHVPTLWGFYRLILKDREVAASVGISEAERLTLIEDVAYSVIGNLGSLAGGTASISLPAGSNIGWLGNSLTYDPLWKINTNNNQIWVLNRYLAGNSADFFCYYDIAKDLQGLALPNTPATTDWKAGEVRELLVRQMDYFLGVNPWDISQVYGVGAKNFNHPHHRAANPEGKNVPGAFYRYRPPVGALHGGQLPSTSAFLEKWSDYRISEVCLDGTTNMLLPVIGLAKEEPLNQLPEITVRIEYVGADQAIIVVRQSRLGTALIRYGTAASALGSVKAADSAGVEHRIVLTGLTPATTYYFQAEAKNLAGLQSINDNAGEKFRFTTLAAPPGPAQIAQVKVCNVSHDSAEILWFTPNGEYDSKVVFGAAKPPTTVETRDVAGRPTKLHYVKIGGLKEKTQYWFYVESGGVRDDNKGQFHTFTTPVEHVSFDIRALSYTFGPLPYLGINIINQDIKSYDSLDIRVYLKGKDADMLDFAAAVDIGIQYDEAGFQGPHFKGELDPLVQASKPVKMEDTFDPATGDWYWYLSLPMGSVVMKSGSRFRLDVTFRKRNLPFDENLLFEPATHVPGPADWSWAAHSRAGGSPIDFGGIKPGNKDDLDNNYWNIQVNPYITVYRKGQFVYGYSPSRKEQETKVPHYQMDVQITSPLNNLPEDYKKINQASPTVFVKGKVSITESGKLTDIWVNGERIADLAQAAAYDATANVWNLNIPVRLKAGANEVDITLFGGADPACQSCVGCAFANRHFHLDFLKADAFPSTLTLSTPEGQPVPALADIGNTRFLVEVQDRNGDATADADRLEVLVFNPNQGDSLRVTLAETGPRTGIFRSSAPVLVQDIPPASSGPGQIAMTEGDTVWVVYVDPTDFEDSARAFLYTPATFPQAVSGWILDANADGAVDRVVVTYSRPPAAEPDSLQVWFPEPSALRTFASPGGGFRLQGTRLEADLLPPFAAGATGFSGDNRNSGRSYLMHEGKLRISAFTLADSAGPVLNRAVLAPASAEGRPDTLTVLFSEAVRYAAGESHPFQARQGGTSLPAADLSISGVVTGESRDARWIFLVNPASRVLLAPGDSLRIAAGILDLPGNRAATENRWIRIEGGKRVPPPVLTLRWDNRVYDTRGIGRGDRAFAWVTRDGAGGWAPVVGSDGRHGRKCPSLDCGATMPAGADGSLSRPSILLETDQPFRYQARIVSNLGAYVAGFAGEVGPDMLEETAGSGAPVRKNPATGKYELRLVWNGKSEKGDRAGTGAYIWSIRVQSSAGGALRETATRRTIGLLRNE